MESNGNDDSCKHPMENLLAAGGGGGSYPTQPHTHKGDCCNNEPTPALVRAPAPSEPTLEELRKFDIVRATQYGVYERVVELLEQGHDVNLPDAENVTLLHWASINNRAQIVRYLVGRGSIIDKLGGDLNSTPLHWAIRQGHLSMVVLLMSYGADTTLRDGEGCAALHLASQFGHTAIVSYLVAKGEDIDMPDKNGMTALMWSAYRVFNSDPTRLLLTFGANASAKDDIHQNNPMHWACVSGNNSAIGLLIKAKSPMEERNAKGMTCLDICKEKKATWIIHKILRGMTEQGMMSDFKKEQSIVAKLGANKDLKKWSTYAMPFLMLFAIGFIPNLETAWYMKLIYFVALFFVWRAISSLYFDHTVMYTMALSLYLATKFWMYVTWFVFYWPYIQSMSIQIPFLINTVFLMYNFIKVWRTDPGVIKTDLDSKFRTVISLAESDTLDFNQFCSTCVTRKPLRSKHCSVCNRCIARFDHHCPWVGNCIGVGNHKYFIGYLFWLLGMITWCFAGAVLYFQASCATDLQTDGFFITLGKVIHCNTWVFWIGIINAGLHFFWVGALLGTQVYQILMLGVTTNEKMNQSRYTRFHTKEKGVYRSPYHRGFFQNFIDLMQWQCFGMFRPDRTNWYKKFEDKEPNYQYV